MKKITKFDVIKKLNKILNKYNLTIVDKKQYNTIFHYDTNDIGHHPDLKYFLLETSENKFIPLRQWKSFNDMIFNQNGFKNVDVGIARFLSKSLFQEIKEISSNNHHLHPLVKTMKNVYNHLPFDTHMFSSKEELMILLNMTYGC